MKNCDLQGIEMTVTAERAFHYLADPANLPAWTNAFASVDVRGENHRAVMRTPAGEVEIGLRVLASRERGTVDWEMRFPDGSQATAWSRVVALGPARCVYTFVLPTPAAALETLEGALEEQSATLRRELARLQMLLEHA